LLSSLFLARLLKSLELKLPEKLVFCLDEAEVQAASLRGLRLESFLEALSLTLCILWEPG
jgi:hypothetical protein